MKGKNTPEPKKEAPKESSKEEPVKPNPPEGIRVGKIKLEVTFPPKPAVITIRKNTAQDINVIHVDYGDMSLLELVGALSMTIDRVKEAAKAEAEFKMGIYALKQAQEEKVQVKGPDPNSIEWIHPGNLPNPIHKP